MYYVPNEEYAFYFVESVMRDTYFGWFIRYIHSNGASFFFFFVYLHMFRSLYYFSYVSPKWAIWNTGVLILVLMIVTAFSGYILPWGQMSFWAATVITNMATALPFFGPSTVEVIWGDYGVSNVTLNRFYTIHFILPFVILFIMIAHFKYLHAVGSGSQTSVRTVDDKKKFHPYYTWKDAIIVSSMIILYLMVINLSPNWLSHSDNYIAADYMSTPEHIVPEWYFLPFYAILRAAKTKLGGVLVLACSILILFYFPNEASRHYTKDKWALMALRGMTKQSAEFIETVTKHGAPKLQPYLFWLFVIVFLGLGYIGTKPVESPYTIYGFVLTLLYFFYFFAQSWIFAFNVWLTDFKHYGRQDYFLLFSILKMLKNSYIKLVPEDTKKYIEKTIFFSWDKVKTIWNFINLKILKPIKLAIEKFEDFVESPMFEEYQDKLFLFGWVTEETRIEVEKYKKKKAEAEEKARKAKAKIEGQGETNEKKDE